MVKLREAMKPASPMSERPDSVTTRHTFSSMKKRSTMRAEVDEQVHFPERIINHGTHIRSTQQATLKPTL
jgi:hypothetical protein